MSREIKFRAWDKESEQMVYSDERDKKDRECDYFFEITSNTVKCYFNCDYDDLMGYPTQTGGELDNIMQYTGIVDSKDKEIYEGDIVYMRCDGLSGYGAVTFNRGCFWIDDKKRNRQYPLYNDAKYRIDGNVYENPELIGG